MVLHGGPRVCVLHLLLCLSHPFLCQASFVFLFCLYDCFFVCICVRESCFCCSVCHLTDSWSGSILTHLRLFPPPSPRRSALHQASTQPCYLLPTLSPGRSPGTHLSRVPSRTRQPAASDRPGHPPAPGTPSAPHCPARAPSVPGCAGASIPTSGLTPAIPHPAAASWSAAPQDSPTLQVQLTSTQESHLSNSEDIHF